VVPTRGPTATPEATLGATAIPASDIAPDSFVRVVTDDLRVRSAPGVGEDSRKLEPLAQDGQGAIVLDGPVEADGYRWYLIFPYFETDVVEDPEPPLGWVAAAGKDGETWLAHDDVCRGVNEPQVWELSELGDYTAQRELRCFGNQAATVTGRLADYGPCVGDAPWRLEPAWFEDCAKSLYLRNLEVAGWEPELSFALSPDATVDPDLVAGIESGEWQSEDGPIVEATGHRDHPTARGCRLVPTGADVDESEPHPALVAYQCRTTFVVTSLGLRGP
jgi:hypothetical protein